MIYIFLLSQIGNYLVAHFSGWYFNMWKAIKDHNAVGIAVGFITLHWCCYNILLQKFSLSKIRAFCATQWSSCLGSQWHSDTSQNFSCNIIISISQNFNETFTQATWDCRLLKMVFSRRQFGNHKALITTAKVFVIKGRLEFIGLQKYKGQNNWVNSIGEENEGYRAQWLHFTCSALGNNAEISLGWDNSMN